MSRRIIFGCPDELDEAGLYGNHPSMVELRYDEHAAHNPGYHQYAGLGDGVAFAQGMPEEAQRGLAYNAMESMREACARDNLSRKRRPGAMGSLRVDGALRRGNEEDEDEDVVDEADVRRGHQIYIGSSMKQRANNVDEVALEESLYNDVVDEDGELPEHRRNWQCAEPAMLSNHRYANDWDQAEDDEQEGHEDGEDEDEADGGRVYVVDHNGRYLPPCEEDSDGIGCDELCDRVGAHDLEDEFEDDDDDD